MLDGSLVGHSWLCDLKSLPLSGHLTPDQDYISDSQSGVPGSRSLTVLLHGTEMKFLILVDMCLF